MTHHPADQTDSRFDPPLRLPQRVGKRLAALGFVGALMVALPLVQVLRYQNSEARSLAAARAGLEPVARAVDVQRGLLAHRDAAALVLAGRDNLELERQIRQREVDERLTTLSTALASGDWQRAVNESEALREDWLSLSRQFGERRVEAGESEQAHRLLVEQTLQIIDLVADVGAPHVAASLQHLQPTLAVAQALPRLAWQIEQLTQPLAAADDATRQRELASAEAGLARTLGTLNAALIVQPRAALADAGAAAGAAADRYFYLLRNARRGSADDRRAELQRAATAALHAQFALFQQAHVDAADQLERRSDAVRLRSGQWLVAMLTLTAMALLLGLAAWRSIRRLVASAEGGAAEWRAPRRQTQPQQQAGVLLARLRDSRAGEPKSNDTQPTLPGRL